MQAARQIKKEDVFSLFTENLNHSPNTAFEIWKSLRKGGRRHR